MDEIIQWDANFSEGFVSDSEHEAFAAQIEMDKEVVEAKALD